MFSNFRLHALMMSSSTLTAIFSLLPGALITVGGGTGLAGTAAVSAGFLSPPQPMAVKDATEHSAARSETERTRGPLVRTAETRDSFFISGFLQGRPTARTPAWAFIIPLVRASMHACHRGVRSPSSDGESGPWCRTHTRKRK